MIEEEIMFKGHFNVQSYHPRTIEVTKEKKLTLRGDCIIGVNSNKACYDLKNELKNKIRNNSSFVEIELIVEPHSFTIHGEGNENLTLTNPHDIVLRKSTFICNRTIAINCNYSALEIPRPLIDLLKDSRRQGIMILRVE